MRRWPTVLAAALAMLVLAAPAGAFRLGRLSKHGEVRKHVDPTIAHRNHIHFGLSKDGAMRRTSYWRQG